MMSTIAGGVQLKSAPPRAPAAPAPPIGGGDDPMAALLARQREKAENPEKYAAEQAAKDAARAKAAPPAAEALNPLQAGHHAMHLARCTMRYITRCTMQYIMRFHHAMQAKLAAQRAKAEGATPAAPKAAPPAPAAPPAAPPPAAPPPAAPLPEPPTAPPACAWEALEADGEVYYANSETSETTWDMPPELSEAA